MFVLFPIYCSLYIVSNAFQFRYYIGAWEAPSRKAKIFGQNFENNYSYFIPNIFLLVLNRYIFLNYLPNTNFNHKLEGFNENIHQFAQKSFTEQNKNNEELKVWKILKTFTISLTTREPIRYGTTGAGLSSQKPVQEFRFR